MQIDNAGMWVLLAVCCAGGLAWAVPRELRRDFYATHGRWREAPWRFAGAAAGAVLTGVAVGLAFALAGTVAGALLTRVV